MKQEKISRIVESDIPCRIIIGVTGHRKLPNEPLIEKKLQEILTQIRQKKLFSHNKDIAFTILSPLAEGADRLAAREILKDNNSQLEVVLPLEKHDYMNDFETPESKTEFEKFLSKAKTITQLAPAESRNEAYAQVGYYVVDHCDILIALWNGKPAAGHGGTAEIVEYARKKRHPLFWIHTEEGARITFEPGDNPDWRLFEIS